MTAVAARMNLTPEEKEEFPCHAEKKGFDDMMSSIMAGNAGRHGEGLQRDVQQEELAGLPISTALRPARRWSTDPAVSAKMQQLMMPRLQQSMMQLQKTAQTSPSTSRPSTTPRPRLLSRRPLARTGESHSWRRA